jgi:hypothetical protein
MHQDRYLGEMAVTRRPDVDPDGTAVNHPVRDITPTDGSIVASGELVSVFCAPCQRWVDCYAGIPPDIVLNRHRNLLH